MKKNKSLVLIFVFAFMTFGALNNALAKKSPIVIIVNKANPIASLSKDSVARIFLRKEKKWQTTGELIVPLDLPMSSSLREQFSNTILNRSLSATKSYWQRMIFSGRDIPPMELPTEIRIIEYVSKNNDAIAYVSEKNDLKNVKIIQIE